MPPVEGEWLYTSDPTLCPPENPHKSSSTARKKIEVTQLGPKNFFFSLLSFFYSQVLPKIILQGRQRNKAKRTASVGGVSTTRLRPSRNSTLQGTAHPKHPKITKQTPK